MDLCSYNTFDMKKGNVDTCYTEFFPFIGKDMFPVSVVGSLTRNGSFWLEKIGKADLEKRNQIQAGIR